MGYHQTHHIACPGMHPSGSPKYQAPAIISGILRSTYTEIIASLGRPAMSNTEYDTYFKGLMPAFRNFRVEINDIVEDVEQEKVVVWAKSSAETEIGPYQNEYMLVFYLNDQSKVTRFLEFVDSATVKDFFPRLRSHIAESR